jgi:hypothetical protein
VFAIPVRLLFVLGASICIEYLANKLFRTACVRVTTSKFEQTGRAGQQLADLPLHAVMMDYNSNSNEAKLDDDAPKFKLFPRLPIELREKIWEEACNEPRVIDLWALPVGRGIGNPRELEMLFGETPFV